MTAVGRLGHHEKGTARAAVRAARLCAIYTPRRAAICLHTNYSELVFAGAYLRRVHRQITPVNTPSPWRRRSRDDRPPAAAARRALWMCSAGGMSCGSGGGGSHDPPAGGGVARRCRWYRARGAVFAGSGLFRVGHRQTLLSAHKGGALSVRAGGPPSDAGRAADGPSRSFGQTLGTGAGRIPMAPSDDRPMSCGMKSNRKGPDLNQGEALRLTAPVICLVKNATQSAIAPLVCRLHCDVL